MPSPLRGRPDKAAARRHTPPTAGKHLLPAPPAAFAAALLFRSAAGPKGTLVFTGQFKNEIAGEDYLNFNVLTAAEESRSRSSAPTGDPAKAKWEAAIDALGLTRVETFNENPAQRGTYIVDSRRTVDVGENDSPKITSPTPPVDSYARHRHRPGPGFVTMVFGDGTAFTAGW